MDLTTTQRLTLEIVSHVKTLDNYSADTEKSLVKNEICRRISVLSAKMKYLADQGFIRKDLICEINALSLI